MGHIAVRNLGLLAISTGLALVACDYPSGSTSSSSENKTAEVASLETLPVNAGNHSAADGSDSGDGYVSGDEHQVPHYVKTVSVALEAVKGNRLNILVPYHVDVNVKEGKGLNVSFRLVASESKYLSSVRSNALTVSHEADATTVALEPQKRDCESLVDWNNSLAYLIGLCIHSVQVSIPQESEFDIHKTNPDGRDYKTLIWVGRVPQNGAELLAAIQPIFFSEDQLIVVKRFAEQQKQAEVTVAELAAINKNFSNFEKLTAIELLAPHVKRSHGKPLKKADIAIILKPLPSEEKVKAMSYLLTEGPPKFIAASPYDQMQQYHFRPLGTDHKQHGSDHATLSK